MKVSAYSTPGYGVSSFSDYQEGSSFFGSGMNANLNSVSSSANSNRVEDTESVISTLAYYDNFTRKYECATSHFDFSRVVSSVFDDDNENQVIELNKKITHLDREDEKRSFFENNGEFFWGVLISIPVPADIGNHYEVLCVVDLSAYLADYKNSKIDSEITGVLKTANSIGEMVLFTKNKNNEINRVFVGEEEAHLHSGVEVVGKCDFKTPESQITRSVKQIESGFFSNFAIVNTDAKIVLIPSETVAKVNSLFYTSFGIPAPKVKVKTEKTSRMGKDCIIS